MSLRESSGTQVLLTEQAYHQATMDGVRGFLPSPYQLDGLLTDSQDLLKRNEQPHPLLSSDDSVTLLFQKPNEPRHGSPDHIVYFDARGLQNGSDSEACVLSTEVRPDTLIEVSVGPDWGQSTLSRGILQGILRHAHEARSRQVKIIDMQLTAAALAISAAAALAGIENDVLPTFTPNEYVMFGMSTGAGIGASHTLFEALNSRSRRQTKADLDAIRRLSSAYTPLLALTESTAYIE